MPTRAPTRCSWFNCDAIATIKGRCKDHARKRPSGKHRDIPEDQRNTARWRTESTNYLNTHKHCRICNQRSTVVDHIIEIADNGAMWDHNNWQPLCNPCHDRKTKTEARRRITRKAQQRRTTQRTETLAMRIWNQQH